MMIFQRFPSLSRRYFLHYNYDVHVNECDLMHNARRSSLILASILIFHCIYISNVFTIGSFTNCNDSHFSMNALQL